MRNLCTLTKLTVVVLTAVLISACESESAYEDNDPSIAFIAVSNPAFSVLEEAAITGGVAGILSNSNAGDPSGDFTVFAPTNAAFARLGLDEQTLGVLQQPFLRNTLFYHVSNGNLRNNAISAGGSSASALGGLTRRFIERDGALYINGSEILATDINADNGTVHVIDKVMIATGGNVVESALALQGAQVFQNPELTFLVAAVVYAELAETLSSPDLNFTVFAPTDAAFKTLLGGAPDIADDGLLGDAYTGDPSDITKLPKELVATVLTYHVFADVSSVAKFTSEMNGGQQAMFNGEEVTLGAFMDGTLTVKGISNVSPANMVIPDVQATNGIVHVIDQVLLPTL
ncbi:MAG: fasciclin domain-containing protein [Leeuwenhoekiella sp.]